MFKPWVKEEGLYITSRFQRFKVKSMLIQKYK